MAGLLDLLMSAMQAAGGKGDRLRDPASNRVAQAFDTASGGPQGGLSPDQAIAYAKSVNPAMRAPETPQQADPWEGLRNVTPGAGVDPMQTASAGPAPGDSNLAWQRGMGSSEGPPAPQGGPGGGGSLNWRELLRALGPALMMADPLGRNQGMAAMMMRQSDERKKGAKDAQAQNQTRQWLLSQGMDEGTAAMMVSDPVLLRQWFGERNKKPEQTDFDQRAAAARAYGLDPNTEAGRNFILSGDLPEARGGAAELGLNPQTGVDENGNPVLIQIGKDGKAVRTAMPEGISLSKEPIKLDAGTHWVLLDPISRQPVGQIPKNLADAEAQKTAGKNRAEAQNELPGAEGLAGLVNDQIQSLKDDPYLPSMLGPIDSRLPNVSEDAERVQGKLDQIKGGAFLQARQLLKGGGAITDYEGKKAEEAFARLRTAQSVGDFKAALDEFNDAVRVGIEKLRQRAGASGASSSGGAVDYKSKYGLD